MLNDTSKYFRPSVTCDAAVVRGGKILMVRRANYPFKDYWALPGGFLDEFENCEECALRELMEETGAAIPLRQAFTVSSVDRDPRGRTVTVCFTNTPYGFVIDKNIDSAFRIGTDAAFDMDNALLNVKAGDDAAAAEWFDIAVSGNGSQLNLTLEGGNDRLLASIEIVYDAFGKMDINASKCIKNDGIAFDHAKIVLKLVKNL